MTPPKARGTPFPSDFIGVFELMPATETRPAPLLAPRQGQVLQAVVSSYVGAATPVASDTIAALLPVRLSAASVRNTLAELEDLGLVEKPHRSAGRIPTGAGFRTFVEQWLPDRELGPFEQRDLAQHLSAEAGGSVEATSRLLSERTRQLGFVVPPPLEGVVLRHVSFVRVSRERVLAILVSAAGRAHQRVLDAPGGRDQAELDRMASVLSERYSGQTLRAVRDNLLQEAAALRSQAEWLLERALRLEADVSDAVDVVVATRLALLEQPEFHDPERVRGLLGAIEEKRHLVDLVEGMLERGVRVAFGDQLGEPGLRDCALVAAPYGPDDAPRGSLGVIGPSRMDYARVVPLVGYVSRLLTEITEA